MAESGAPIDFWFDFASGYAYFAAHGIDGLEQRTGRTVIWRPYILGTAFQVTGVKGLSSTPLKKDYALRDWQRLSRLLDLPFALPPRHPAVALAATRAFYWLDDRDPALAKAFARMILDRYFTGGIDSGDAAQVADAAREALGVDADALRAAMADPALKARVRSLSENAVAGGVFGSPFFIVDGEPFWGWDRMGMVEDWVRRQGW